MMYVINNNGNHTVPLNVQCRLDFMQIQYKWSIYSSVSMQNTA